MTAKSARQDDVFLQEVDLDLKLVERHPVLKIPIEAVGLLDQHHTDGWMRLEVGDHLAKSRAAGLLRRLHIDEFVRNREAVGGCIVLQQLLCAGIEKPSFSCSFEETRA